MGGKNSRYVEAKKANEPESVVDHNTQIANLIGDFTSAIGMYKSNDMKQIKGFLNKHYPKEKERAEIIAVINKVDESLYDRNGNVSADAVNSDKALYDTFKQINESGLDPIKRKFVEDPLIREDASLAEKVNGIFTPYTNLRTEAMFYRYKYIQVNIILIILITQFQDLFDTTFSAIAADFALKLEKQKALLEHFINIAQSLSADSQALNDEDRKNIDKVSGEAIDQLQKFINESKDKIDKLSADTPNYLAQMLLETQQLTMKQMEEINRKVENKKPQQQ